MAFLLTLPECTNISEVYELVKNGEDIDSTDSLGNSLLHYSSSDPVIINFLLSLGANPNIQNLQGVTPLHVASASDDNFYTIELLLNYGADPNIRNRYGRTPLHIACREGSIGIAEKLISNNANTNIKDLNGYTPIIYGCFYYPEKMNYLSDKFGVIGCTPKYTLLDSKNYECDICFETNKNFVKINDCGHIFCKKCIDTWINKGDRTCPMCRNKFFGGKRHRSKTRSKKSRTRRSKRSKT